MRPHSLFLFEETCVGRSGFLPYLALCFCNVLAELLPDLTELFGFCFEKEGSGEMFGLKLQFKCLFQKKLRLSFMRQFQRRRFDGFSLSAWLL